MAHNTALINAAWFFALWEIFAAFYGYENMNASVARTDQDNHDLALSCMYVAVCFAYMAYAGWLLLYFPMAGLPLWGVGLVGLFLKKRSRRTAYSAFARIDPIVSAAILIAFVVGKIR